MLTVILDFFKDVVLIRCRVYVITLIYFIHIGTTFNLMVIVGHNARHRNKMMMLFHPKT